MAEKYGHARSGAITKLLIRDYLAGKKIEELYEKYGINTSTISIYLRNHKLIRELYKEDADAVICDIALQRKNNIRESCIKNAKAKEKGKSK